MPFSNEQLAYAGNAAINYYLKNDPVDQYNVARPLIKWLSERKREYVGGLQYVVEQLRYNNDSNFQSYFGDSQVTYNRKRTLNQAKFVWGAFHDGFGLNEDELAQNGIVVTDDRSSTPSEAEKVQLTNLLKENMETLKLGWQEKFDIMLHLNGTQSATNIPGLDNLVSTSPMTSSVVGGLDQSVYPWWQNTGGSNGLAGNFMGISISTAGNLTQQLEILWRNATRYGGTAPDYILAGESFIDNYRADAKATINRTIFVKNDMKGGVAGMDGSVGDGTRTGLYFKNVEVVWDPVLSVLDTLYPGNTYPFQTRCYFLNSRFMSLRPLTGHWMVARKPARVYDRYVHYWGLTAKAAFTVSKRNSLAVCSSGSIEYQDL